MKKPTSKKTYTITQTPAQRFWGIMALTALFICGVMVGWDINSYRSKTNSAPTPTENTEASVSASTPTVSVPNRPTCDIIQELLTEQLPPADGSADDRIIRAQIYANLSERGCPENSAAYATMAKQELEIARALTNDEFNEPDTLEVIETYKRLNMQAAAEEVFDMARRLTTPTIDFILAVEKIINEQQ